MGLFDDAQKEYPILSQLGLQYKENYQNNGNYLEFWPKDEPGDEEYPRPKEFAMDKPGIEVYDKTTRPIDILGDVVSHHLVNESPLYKDYYQQFENSLSNDQSTNLMHQYRHAVATGGEKRSYPDWYNAAGLPAYFRGYAFNQWDHADKMYTPDQMAMFDNMMKDLKAGKR